MHRATSKLQVAYFRGRRFGWTHALFLFVSPARVFYSQKVDRRRRSDIGRESRVRYNSVSLPYLRARVLALR